MASIRKRTNRWQARITRKGLPELCKTFTVREDALKWARSVEREIDTKSFLLPSKVDNSTLGDLIIRYENEIVPKLRGAVPELFRLAKINKELGRVKLLSLNPSHIADYRDKRLLSVTPSTCLRELQSLSAMLNHALREWRYSFENPVSSIRKPVANHSRTRRLEGDEENRLIRALECRGRRSNGQMLGGTRNHWIKPIVQLALVTAMRRGELISLEWKNVNLEKRVAYLPMIKNGLSRTVPLSNLACDILRALPRSLTGKVFPISADALKSAFVRACNSAGIFDFHFHDLRHEAISRMARFLPNLIELAAVTGHQDLKMLRRYYHIHASELALKLG